MKHLNLCVIRRDTSTVAHCGQYNDGTCHHVAEQVILISVTPTASLEAHYLGFELFQMCHSSFQKKAHRPHTSPKCVPRARFKKSFVQNIVSLYTYTNTLSQTAYLTCCMHSSYSKLCPASALLLSTSCSSPVVLCRAMLHRG